MRGRKLSFTMRSVLLFGILLFLANSVLGMVVLSQSKTAMKTLINKNMLDVAQSAAGTLDGDALASLTIDDVGGPAFHGIADRLLVFQNSADIKYIYAVKELDDGRFIFTVDPDPVEPAAFGEEVVTTPALLEAATGVSTVDDKPVSDRWGTYYSAFCPVFDSSGNVAGVVGVDFDSEWYDAQVQQHTLSIAVVSAISVVLGGVVVILIANRVHTKFKVLSAGLEGLSNDVDVLVKEMTRYSGAETVQTHRHNISPVDAADEMEALGQKIRTMQAEMSMYLDYLHAQAYTDALTQLGNSAAYHEAVGGLSKRIEDGTANFHVIVFDINGLKDLNDNFGHDCGDIYIRGAASALMEGFESAHQYRIGGDEFVVIVEEQSQQHVRKSLLSVAAAIDAFNESTSYPAELVVSQGAACFDSEKDATYDDVFSRADRAMYENKREFYLQRGALPRHRARFDNANDNMREQT